MRALIWEAVSTMNMRDVAQPTVEDDEVLIKVAYTGICGSELGGFLGHNALRVPPIVMGHEFSGAIVDLGKNATSINPTLALDKLATVNPLDYCGACEYCQHGLNQLCVKRRLVGAHRQGAFAEYVAIPAKLVSVLPDGMSARTGALTEPAGCAVRIGELAGDVVREDCLIIGAGPIGLLALQVLQLNGAARVFLAEIDADRLAMAEALGAIPINPKASDTVQAVKEATGNSGVAVAVDAVGTATTRAQCVQSLKATGTLIFSGLHEETSALPIADIIRREIVALGSFAYSPANFAHAIELLAQSKLRLDPWITEAPLSEGQQWFERLIGAPGDVSKVLLVP